MIVKTISHKSDTRQSMLRLINYVFDEDKMSDKNCNRRPIILKHLVKGFNRESWAEQFYQNDQARSYNHTKRTVLRHEIMSFSDKDTNISRDTLKDLAQFFLKHRSPQSLCLAACHYDETPHIHFIISGSRIDTRSSRISQTQLKQFKLKLQAYQQEKYPHLFSVVDHTKKRELKLSQAERQMQQNNKESEKMNIATFLKSEASKCENLDQLENILKKEGVQTYYRKDFLTGVVINSRKYRMTTLGVHSGLFMKLTLAQKRINEMRANQNNEKNISKAL